ncbi:MAG: VOC family protein [Tannerellaceae bacterium]|jgi:PhnB protein|nr:VOC family protein [Tannerellaceae bacterium]
MANVNCYLAFDGYCEEAFRHYEKVFGKPITYVGYYRDMPGDAPIPENQQNYVMHINLPINGENCLMGCDTIEGYAKGNNVSICVGADTADEAQRIFDGLAEGGTVVMPLEKSFFAALFGMVTDHFGICWLVIYEGKEV